MYHGFDGSHGIPLKTIMFHMRLGDRIAHLFFEYKRPRRGRKQHLAGTRGPMMRCKCLTSDCPGSVCSAPATGSSFLLPGTPRLYLWRLLLSSDTGPRVPRCPGMAQQRSLDCPETRLPTSQQKLAVNTCSPGEAPFVLLVWI